MSTRGDGGKLVIGHVDGPFKDLGVRGAKRGCFAIGAVEQGISGSDTGIRRRFFVQHDLDKRVEIVCLRASILDAVSRSTDMPAVLRKEQPKAMKPQDGQAASQRLEGFRRS